MARRTKGYSLFSRKDSGRWVLSHAIAPNKWKQVALPTEIASRAEAERWVREHLAEVRRLGPPPPSLCAGGPTIRELAPRWLELRKADARLAPATVRDNASHLNTHVLPHLGDTPLAALEVAQLRGWVRRLRSERASCTTRNVVATLMTFVDDCMAEDWVRLPANPVRHPGVKKELPAFDDRLLRRNGPALSIGDVQALIDCQDIPVMRRIRYALAFTSGLRDGEISGLRFMDVELDAQVPHLQVRQAVAMLGNAGFATESKLKTRSSARPVPLHPCGIAALRWWRDAGWERHACRIPGPLDPVFPNDKGGPCRPPSARLLKADVTRAGLACVVPGGVHFHDARRCFSSWLVIAGVQEAIVRRLLGHAGTSVTQRHYLALDLKPLFDAVAMIAMTWQPTEEPDARMDAAVVANSPAPKANGKANGVHSPALPVTSC